jgi:hypothetical protein
VGVDHPVSAEQGGDPFADGVTVGADDQKPSAPVGAALVVFNEQPGSCGRRALTGVPPRTAKSSAWPRLSPSWALPSTPISIPPRAPHRAS